MEVFKSLPTGTLAEVIENTLYMSPTPTSNHQRMIVKLVTQIAPWVGSENKGEVFVAPLDVYLDNEDNAVQPDILFIAKENLNIVKENGHVHGIPDLIIEILYPGNRSHDLVVKKNLYEKFGVPEYWIVDPLTGQTSGYQLKEGRYTLIMEDSSIISSPLLQKTFQLS